MMAAGDRRPATEGRGERWRPVQVVGRAGEARRTNDESGRQEFESLRARQHLASGLPRKNIDASGIVEPTLACSFR